MLILFNLIVRIWTSLVMIIPDCDETFNYWEPLNFLVRAFGKQTWEYSPEFAIRSYAYLMPYYLVIAPIKYVLDALHVSVPSYVYFYIGRMMLACFTAYSEWRLYKSLLSAKGTKVARSYLFLSTVSTGMAHAGVELLPSSFAMQCMTLSLSYCLLDFTVGNAVAALSWIMVGGIVGWPFALVLAVPYGLYVVSVQYRNLAGVIVGCSVNLISIVSVVVLVDSLFYRRLVLIPLNIVLYNVFGGEGEGPEIFGVEPLSYYVLNLVLNFNLLIPLSVLAIVLVRPQKNWVVVNGPLLIWTGVFFSEPHKEERFLYPIYSLILVNSATGLTFVYECVQSLITAPKVKKTMKGLYLLAHLAIAVLCGLRTINLVENYSAPLSVSKELSLNSNNVPDISPVNVCVGREWYHFPNSFFLPDNHRLAFVQSGFDGLLPRDFNEGVELFEATSFIPTDMNNKNLFSATTVIPIQQCHYYIDNSGKTNGEEPDIVGNPEASNWQTVGCKQIIDPDGNHGFGRLLYVPHKLRSLIPYGVEYMDLCLLQHTGEPAY